jgi:glutamate dehydrogenase/leucine dehydrogenase
VGTTVAALLTKTYGIEVVAFDVFDRSDAVDSPLYSWCPTLDALLHTTGADLFCPCADGHVLSKAVVLQLKAVGVTSILGAANHQVGLRGCAWVCVGVRGYAGCAHTAFVPM